MKRAALLATVILGLAACSSSHKTTATSSATGPEVTTTTQAQAPVTTAAPGATTTTTAPAKGTTTTQAAAAPGSSPPPAGPGPTSGATTTTAPQGTVVLKAASDPQYGQIVTDAGGRSVYFFTQDHGSTSACTGACSVAWPPLMAPSNGQRPIGGPGINSTEITVAHGQIMYYGHLLYHYQRDTGPGQTNGHGAQDWYLIRPSGAKVP